MKTIIKYALIFLLLPTVNIDAKNVGIDKAEVVAKNWIKSSNLSKQRTFTVSDVITQNINNKPALYIFNFENGGFVIVSADDNVQPVLGYSYQNNINPDDQNTGLKLLLQNYRKQISEFRTKFHKKSLQSPAADQWQQIENNSIILDEQIDPIISTNWDQDYPYNALCPIDTLSSDDHVLVGCVATAMGQIMKYHNYPDSGNGSHTFTHVDYGMQSVFFDSTHYDWINMPSKIYETSTSGQIDAVATLMYHCGVAVNMDYGIDASGAYSEDVPNAMKTYFDYSSEIKKLNRAAYSDENWKKILLSELHSKRPLYYAGRNDENGGHAFICDGYQKQMKLGEFFHFNWGWSGSSNGYFTIDDMMFDYGQSIILNIAPNGKMAKFTSDQNKGILPLTVQFSDLSEGNPTAWKWDFDNNGIIDSEEQNPTYTYETAGDFTVSLIVSRDSTEYQKIETNYIEVIKKDELYGSIETDRILDAGIVTVKDDVKVEKNVTLTIMPGTTLLFEDYYKLEILGIINAIGTVDDSIYFAIKDTTGFSDLESEAGGWNGINLNMSRSDGDSSVFKYCNFKNVKKNFCIQSIKSTNLEISNSTFENNIGVALGIWFSNLKFENSIIKNSKIHNNNIYNAYASCITSFYSDISINNCLIANNMANQTGIILLSNSSTLNINNSTITNNYSSSDIDGLISIQTKCNLNISNSIIWNENFNEISCNGNVNLLIEYSNLQNGLQEITGDKPNFQGYLGNINVSPEFIENGYELSEWSQCINNGNLMITGDINPNDLKDLAGNPRWYAETQVDIGAYEFQNENQQFDIGFTSSVETGDYPLSVDFTDTSKIDGIIDRKWDFNSDGTWDDEGNNVTWIYDIPGLYSVNMLILTADSIPVIEYKEGLINVTGTSTEINETPDNKIPESYSLSQNYPNPFNSSTSIKYSIPEHTHVMISIFDLLGNKVDVLVNESKEAGNYIYKWNGINSLGKHLPSGVYLYKLETKQFSDSKKMFFMK